MVLGLCLCLDASFVVPSLELISSLLRHICLWVGRGAPFLASGGPVAGYLIGGRLKMGFRGELPHEKSTFVCSF